MQDILNLAEENRMNTPGTIEDNWQWSFQWDQVADDTADVMHHLLALYGRI
jgi:4-alpha-glucanotransferase